MCINIGEPQRISMTSAIAERAKLFIFDPEKAFKKNRGASVGNAFGMYARLGIVFAVLSGVVAALSGSFAPLSAFLPGPSVGVVAFLIGAVGGYIGVLIGGLIGGLWLHLWAYIFGARQGLHQTFKVLFFGATPSLAFGWIPFIGMLAGFWSLYLEFKGLVILQKMKPMNAVLAIVVPLIIFVIVVLAIVLFSFGLFAASGGLPGTPFSYF